MLRFIRFGKCENVHYMSTVRENILKAMILANEADLTKLSTVTASVGTSLDCQDINATTVILSNTNNHSSHTLIKHIPNSKGTGCASSECTVAEVNKYVFTATDGDGYINKDDSSFFRVITASMPVCLYFLKKQIP